MTPAERTNKRYLYRGNGKPPVEWPWMPAKKQCTTAHNPKAYRAFYAPVNQ